MGPAKRKTPPTQASPLRVLITGASSGIGEATARAMVQEFPRLSFQSLELGLVARRGARLRTLQSELMKLSKELGFYGRFKVFLGAFDICDGKAFDRYLEGWTGAREGLSILVNSAGLARGLGPLHRLDPAHIREVFETNVLALMSVTQKVLPGMIRTQGHVVNIGSVAGRWTYPGGSSYCGSKFAVHAISETLRQDLLGTGVRVTEILPGMVETEFSLVRLQDVEAAKRVYQGMTPLRALDVADAILWAVTRPRHVNVQEVVLFPTDQAAVGQVHRGG